uniref:Uncharacterized protein n=1 Tax=Avena sativa TaxID=4498 RepID=A0ACD5TNF1_AVESA
MLPSPPLSVARRAATAAASAAAHHLLPSVSSPILEPSLPSPAISRRRIRLMPLGERAPLAPLPPCGRTFAGVAGGEGVKGEVPALVVVSFYRFADFPDHADFRRPLKKLCEELRVSGGIILAPEGINGSLCGIPEAVEKVLHFIQADDRFKGLRMIKSPVTPEDEAIHHGHTSHSPVGAGEDAPFRWDHVRVKLKKEIVSFGDPGVMPTKTVGKYIKPNDWNALISDPDTVVIDVRNMYEIRIGKFNRAVDPCTESFREFPSWVDNQFQLAESDSHLPSVNGDTDTEGPGDNLNSSEPKELPRVAMYCTGGIRCEKASSFLLSKGFKEVYHLEGGILKYLEEIPEAGSLWEGECFVLTSVFQWSMG